MSRLSRATNNVLEQFRGQGNKTVEINLVWQTLSDTLKHYQTDTMAATATTSIEIIKPKIDIEFYK